MKFSCDEKFKPAKGTSPPRAPLILRVGVTGHRPDKLEDMDLDALNTQLSEIFRGLESIIKDADTNAAGAFTTDPPLLRIISPLADGADQIVASVAIEHGFELQSPIPFFKPKNVEDTQKLYGNNLGISKAVLELDSSPENKEHAYEAAGRMVLRHSDVLIAIWDKQNARGIGGTAQIVDEAGRLWIPTIRVDPVKPHNAFLRVPNNDEEEVLDIKTLRDLILPDLIPPVPEKHTQKPTRFHEDDEDLREYYFKEKIPRFSIAVLGKFFQKLLGYGPLPEELIAKSRKEVPLVSQEGQDQLSKVAQHIDEKLCKHYEYTDALANHYLSLYYSGFIWNYLMSSCAVLFAFLAFGLHVHAFGYAELFAIASIVFIYFADKNGRWHDRRIDYRLLAELIRQTRFLATLGRVPPLSSPEPMHTHYGDPSSSWVYWHFQALVKQLGMIEAKFTTDYLKAVAQLIKSETDEQSEYHFRKFKENRNINNRLHYLSIVMFVLAAIGCSLHLVKELPIIQANAYIRPFLNDHHNSLNVILSLLSIASPAFGAAFAGIRSQGEFERVARHSVAMAEYLQEKSSKLITFLLEDHKLNSASLAQIVDDIAEKMIEEMLDWRIVFHKRPIEL